MSKENKSKNINHLFVLDEQTAYLAEKINLGKKDKLIQNPKKWSAFLNDANFELEAAVILCELGWEGKYLQDFYGYEVARTLIERAKEPFNLHFITTLKRETIYDIFQELNRVFTQKFPHTRIDKNFELDKIDILELSERKFNYLKNYALLETGIIDILAHDFKKPDIRNKENLINKLRTNSSILNEEILNKAEELDKASKPDRIKTLFQAIRHQLEVLSTEYSNDKDEGIRKSYYQVLLVEDNEEANEILTTQLSKYFVEIDSVKSGTTAKDRLKNHPHSYDVVITDMELLQENRKFDDRVQGIDILELCENKYPFLITRIISGLPKNAIKNLTGKKVTDIIYKDKAKDSVFPSTEPINQFIERINKEEKRKRSLQAKQGPFNNDNWWGEYLSEKLYSYQREEPEAFKEMMKEVTDRARSFVNGEMDDLTEDQKLSTSFISPKTFEKKPQKLWKLKKRLLTHRLIAYHYAAIHNWERFHYTGNGQKNYAHQEGFADYPLDRVSNGYFQTMLGIRGEGFKGKRETPLKCKIFNKDLFLWEIDWLEEMTGKSVLTLEDSVYPARKEFFRFCDDFVTAFTKEEIDRSELTFRDVLIDLQNFEQYYDPDKYDHNMLKIFFGDYYDSYDSRDSLPEEMEQLLKNIKDKFF